MPVDDGTGRRRGLSARGHDQLRRQSARSRAPARCKMRGVFKNRDRMLSPGIVRPRAAADRRTVSCVAGCRSRRWAPIRGRSSCTWSTTKTRPSIAACKSASCSNGQRVISKGLGRGRARRGQRLAARAARRRRASPKQSRRPPHQPRQGSQPAWPRVPAPKGDESAETMRRHAPLAPKRRAGSWH